MKRIAAWILVLLMITTAAAQALGEPALRGYDTKEKYQYVYFGHYPYDSKGTVKPLLWRVLEVTEDGYALLLTEFVIDTYPMQVIDPHANLTNYKYYRMMKTYEDSDLFPWLNSEMLNTMFTETEQAALDDSRGKLFLLDREEYRRADYGFHPAVYGVIRWRICKATGYAQKRSCYVENNGSPYWTATLRNPDKGTQCQIVGYDGHMSYAGYGRRHVGIRPGVRVRLDQVALTAGHGTW